MAFFFANSVEIVEMHKMKSELCIQMMSIPMPDRGICIFMCTPEDIGQGPLDAFIRLSIVFRLSDLFCQGIKNFNSRITYQIHT